MTMFRSFLFSKNFSLFALRFSKIKSFAECLDISRQSSTKCFELRGIFPPITTSFKDDEQVDWENIKANLQKWEKVPFRGYVVLGSTGEFVSMSEVERVSLVKFVKQTVSKQKYVIAGSGCESTMSTIEQTKRMADVGADAALIVTPCFYKGRMTDDALFKHYTKIADSSPIPVILYSVPANTGVDLSASLVCRLADHPNIIGLKDSGGDITKIGSIVHKTEGKNSMLLLVQQGFCILHCALVVLVEC